MSHTPVPVLASLNRAVASNPPNLNMEQIKLDFKTAGNKELHVTREAFEMAGRVLEEVSCQNGHVQLGELLEPTTHISDASLTAETNPPGDISQAESDDWGSWASLEHQLLHIDTMPPSNLADVTKVDERITCLTLVVTRIYDAIYFLKERNYFLSKPAVYQFKANEAAALEEAKRSCGAFFTQKVKKDLLPNIYAKNSQNFRMWRNEPEQFDAMVQRVAEERRNESALKRVKPVTIMEARKVRCVDTETGRMLTILISNPNYFNFPFQEGKAYSFTNLRTVRLQDTRKEMEFEFCSTSAVFDSPLATSERIGSSGESQTYARRYFSFAEIKNWSQLHPLHNEIDTVAKVVAVGNYNTGSGQTIVLTDHTGEHVCVKLWQGVQASGWEDVIRDGNVITAENLLIKRPISEKRNMLFDTETTRFNKSVSAAPPHLLDYLKILLDSDMICENETLTQCQRTSSAKRQIEEEADVRHQESQQGMIKKLKSSYA